MGQKQRLEAADRGEITYQPAKGLVLPEVDEVVATRAPSAPAPVEPAASLGEESIENADELAGKLEALENHDGRRMGHRIRISD